MSHLLWELNQNWTGSLPFTIIYSKKSGSVIVDFWEGKKSESEFKSAIDIAINFNKKNSNLVIQFNFFPYN